jgi:cyclopropane-fatty-acyl-phospholipid synthase
MTAALPPAEPKPALLDRLLERDLLPDALIRFGIRRLLARRLRTERARYDRARYAADLRRRALAEQTQAANAANAQHYEVPTAFYQLCLGPRLKYSACYYPTGRETLAAAEEHMLELYLRRGQLADGQRILELGCGWGSLSLYLAERFPRAQITGVSNSRTQREHIEAEARRRGLANLRILTCDINALELEPAQFDRVVSVEMFEHLKNYERLFAQIARWLRPGGKMFVHIFTHARLSYHFEPEGPGDWMARHFFTGGQMPAHDLLAEFQGDLRLARDWRLEGRHYQQTAEHWLENMDTHRAEILRLFAGCYGPGEALKWWSYWRIFFLSCAELWGYRQGEEWQVSHYLFERS